MNSKIISGLAGLLLFSLPTPSIATVAVVDVGLIRTNLLNARRDLAEQVLQRGQQVIQVKKLVTQIQQIDSYLDRFGDPKNVTIQTFNSAADLLGKLNLSKTSEEIVGGIGKDEIFKSSSDSPYQPLKREIVLGGDVVAEQDSKVFTPEVAARRTFQHYQEVRSSVLERRKMLRTEMERTLSQLRSATTSSEVQKLNIVMRSLESQLASSDREMQFAANEVMTRYFESQSEERVQAKARVQKERAALRVGTEKDLGFYRIPKKPLLFKR